MIPEELSNASSGSLEIKMVGYSDEMKIVEVYVESLLARVLKDTNN